MNSNLTRKRSRSTYPASKMAKLTIPSKEVPVQQGESTFPSDVTSDEIPSVDWLTATCQFLGEVPALYETLDDVQPQLIIDMSEPNSSSADPHPESTTKTQALSEPTPLQNQAAAGSKIEAGSSTFSKASESSKIESNPSARKSSEVLHEWNLDDGLVVSLHRSEWKLHIHIRKNSQHIVMTVPTYCDFKNQLAIVGKPFERPSIICNNQLAVFSYADKLILQQIFHFEHFKFKNHSLELNLLDESRLEYAFKHIDDAIKVAIFESVLSKQLPKMSHINPTRDEIDTLHEFMLVINEEIARHVKALFVCFGCKLSSSGQLSHDCITVDYSSQCSIIGEESILLINPRRIANILREKGISHYFNNDFFSMNKYDDIRSLMEM